MKTSGSTARFLLTAFGGALAILLFSSPGLVGTIADSLQSPPAKHVVARAQAAESEEDAPLDQSRLASATVAKLPRSSRVDSSHPPRSTQREAGVTSIPPRRPKIPPLPDPGADPH